MAEIWGYDFVGETRTVDTHVQQVRKKMKLKEKLVTIPKVDTACTVKSIGVAYEDMAENIYSDNVHCYGFYTGNGTFTNWKPV